MTPRQIIIALEEKGLKRMEKVRGRHDDKVRVIRNEIARACEVSLRTVNNWRTEAGGRRIGPQSKLLLESLAAREGVYAKK